MTKPHLNSQIFDRNSLIIASTTIAGDLLSTICTFYYIKVFLNIYHLNTRWLNIAQILFALWNAINDPLFGCVQDVGFAWCPRWLMNRRKVILYLGPVYAASFMVFWIPWSSTDGGGGEPDWLIGVHLLVSLFWYDSMVSLVLSAQCGLFAESTTQHDGRVRVAVYLEMASMVAGFVLLPVDAISRSLDDFRAFQICAGVVAVLSCGFFLITGLLASDEIAQMSSGQNAKDRTKPATAGQSVAEGRRVIKAILSDRDFWCVVLGNFFHILRMTGDQNFLAILTEALLSPNGILTVGSIQISLFYAGCIVLSKVFLVACWPILHRFGPFVCLMITVVLSAINCIVTLIVGRMYYSWLALYFLFENILSKGLWPAVYNIFFPDIIDEDMAHHKRKSPLSTLIFTMNALFTKPAHSLAPMIVVALLNNAGYKTYLEMKNSRTLVNGTSSSDGGGYNTTTMLVGDRNTTIADHSDEAERFEQLYSTMFYVACLFPLACVILEAACFIPYRLKFRHRRRTTDGKELEVEMCRLDPTVAEEEETHSALITARE